MNYRRLLHRLAVAVAIGMVVAALAYRSDAHARSSANPPAPASNRDDRDGQGEIKGAENTKEQQQRHPRQEPGEPGAKLLQQQERVARLQWRL